MRIVLTLSRPMTEPFPEAHKWIQIRSKFCLIHPSQQLFDFISILENATLTALNSQKLNQETMFDVTSALANLGSIPYVGCP